MEKELKLFKISQDVNNDYDTYSDAVVIAETKEEAKRIHPTDYIKDIYYDEKKKQFWTYYEKSKEPYLFEDQYGSWTNDLTKIKVIEVGICNNTKFKKGDIICASFHAG